MLCRILLQLFCKSGFTVAVSHQTSSFVGEDDNVIGLSWFGRCQIIQGTIVRSSTRGECSEGEARVIVPKERVPSGRGLQPLRFSTAIQTFELKLLSQCHSVWVCKEICWRNRDSLCPSSMVFRACLDLAPIP